VDLAELTANRPEVGVNLPEPVVDLPEAVVDLVLETVESLTVLDLDLLDHLTLLELRCPQRVEGANVGA
jgi:hypothetical protein